MAIACEMEYTNPPVYNVVIRVCVVNMRGEIVLDTLVKPVMQITETNQDWHGISKGIYNSK